MIDLDSCVLWLDSRYFSESRWWDRSKYRNDGVVNGAKWKANAFYFDGVNDYVDCGNNENLNLTDAFTIIMWIKRTEELFSTHAGLVARSNRQYALKGRKDTKQVSLYVSDDNGYDSSLPTSELEKDTWYCIAGVYEDETDMFNIYIDGILDVEDSTTKSIHSSPAEHLYIAYEIGTYYFQGYVGSVYMFNRALSDNEIQLLYDLTYRKI